MNHMMREITRKVAGTAVTTMEASKMPCNIALTSCVYKTFIHLEVQVDAKQRKENCSWDCNCNQLQHADNQPGQQETALENT